VLEGMAASSNSRRALRALCSNSDDEFVVEAR